MPSALNWRGQLIKVDTCCRKCRDIRIFKENGGCVRKVLKLYHDEIVSDANQRAKTTPYISLNLTAEHPDTWRDMWFCEFKRTYDKLFDERLMLVISEYEEECFKRNYGENEQYNCSYHAQQR